MSKNNHKMVKSYLRYEPALSFGVITSVDSNISYDSSGKYLLAGALEKVGVWHMRQGVCNKTLAPTASSSSRGHALAVTSLASSPTSFVISSSNPFYLFCFVFFLKDILQLVNVVVLFIYFLSYCACCYKLEECVPIRSLDSSVVTFPIFLFCHQNKLTLDNFKYFMVALVASGFEAVF